MNRKSAYFTSKVHFNIFSIETSFQESRSKREKQLKGNQRVIAWEVSQQGIFDPYLPNGPCSITRSIKRVRPIRRQSEGVNPKGLLEFLNVIGGIKSKPALRTISSQTRLQFDLTGLGFPRSMPNPDSSTECHVLAPNTEGRRTNKQTARLLTLKNSLRTA